ncbi:hypothetical protein ACFJGV_05250 [Cnuibacter sp. UC19_7]|uniref:hypothetical protein n=1 Tax=Cnuibacter sp. UC19_7 TaxID=3350166 RepID=UPI00366CC0A5
MSSRDDDAFSWAGDDDPTLRPASERDEADDATVVEELETRDAVAAAAASGDSVATPPAQAPRSGARPTPAARPGRSVLEEAEEAEELAAARDLADAERETAPLSSIALIVMGILGGVYALYTIGWLVSFSRFPVGDGFTFTILSIRMLQVLAVAAAPLWFGGVLLILQKRPIRYRFLWLVIGVLVLVPWPFLMGV